MTNQIVVRLKSFIGTGPEFNESQFDFSDPKINNWYFCLSFSTPRLVCNAWWSVSFFVHVKNCGIRVSDNKKHSTRRAEHIIKGYVCSCDSNKSGSGSDQLSVRMRGSKKFKWWKRDSMFRHVLPN